MGGGPEVLATTVARLRGHALDAFRRGVESVEPRARTAGGAAVILDRWFADPARPRRLYVLGAGKAVCAMARGVQDAVVEVLGASPGIAVIGVLVCPLGAREEVPGMEVLEAPHPVPGPGSEAAGRRLLAVAARVQEGDVVLGLLSGGASALLATPASTPGYRVDSRDLEEVTRRLLVSGAPITEVNTVRKHLSDVAGGLLGLALERVRAACLVVSDVVGDDLSVIASGPFYGDDSTFGQCREILSSYGLDGGLPPAVAHRLEMGMRGRVPETPSPDDPRLARIEHRVVASGLDACRAAAARCGELGYRPLLVSHTLEGEARGIGELHAGLARGVHLAGVPLAAPCALISGGEATVAVRGDGVGGRNQETCLAAVQGLAGLPAAFLSAGTDGIDGPTAAAGGLVDGMSFARARAAGVDVPASRARNDSHTALRALGDLVLTGDTGTNVADLRVLLVAG